MVIAPSHSVNHVFFRWVMYNFIQASLGCYQRFLILSSFFIGTDFVRKSSAIRDYEVNKSYMLPKLGVCLTNVQMYVTHKYMDFYGTPTHCKHFKIELT